MNFLPEVCLGPRNHPSNFVDDSDYDPDPARIQIIHSLPGAVNNAIAKITYLPQLSAFYR